MHSCNEAYAHAHHACARVIGASGTGLERGAWHLSMWIDKIWNSFNKKKTESLANFTWVVAFLRHSNLIQNIWASFVKVVRKSLVLAIMPTTGGSIFWALKFFSISPLCIRLNWQKLTKNSKSWVFAIYGFLSRSTNKLYFDKER